MPVKNSKAFVTGLQKLHRGDLQEAAKHLREVVLADSDMHEIYVLLGAIYRELGETRKAIHVHESMLLQGDLSPELSTQLNIELARDYRLFGEYGAAIDYIMRAMKSDKDPSLILELAGLYCADGRHDYAIKNFTKYSKITGNSMKKRIAYCYVKSAVNVKDAPARFFKTMKSAIKADNMCRRARYEIALYFRNEQRYSKCIDEASSILNDDLIFSEDNLRFLEGCYFDAGRVEEFFKIILKKSGLENQNPLYHSYAADLHSKKGDRDKALEVLRKYSDKFGPKVLITRKYADLTGDELVKSSAYSFKPFICASCGAKYEKYRDICAECSAVETVKPF